MEVVVVGRGSVGSSLGTAGDFGQSGGQGKDTGVTVPASGTSFRTYSSVFTGSAPRLASLLSLSSASPISLAHSSSECTNH